MRKMLTALVCALTLSMTAGCYTMNHTVGEGARGTQETSKRQWFALWGLVPITDTDSQDLAGDAKDYTVETEFSIINILLNLVTTWVTITSQDMTVTK